MFGLRCYAYRWYNAFQKSNVAEQKPEVSKPFVVICGSHHISSFRTSISEIPTAIPMFSSLGPAVQWCCRRCHRNSRYTRNTYGGRPKLEVTLFQHIGQLETKFQRLHPYFLCCPVQQRCCKHNRKSCYTGNKYGGRPNPK